MDWITPEVAIGNYVDAQSIGVLREFRSVLGLTPTLRDLRLRRRDTIALFQEMIHDEHQRDAVEADFTDLFAELHAKRIETFDLVDGPGNDSHVFCRAVETLTELARDAPPVLVHCHAGRSRSAVVVAGYLMRTRKLTATDALNYVDARRDVFTQDVMIALLEHLA